ncbi:hypothetical protein BTA51_04850 [Hahella sp. CCB-MM4]|uniref:type III secretion system stalk subunit SctO n=1 Tax=Hahella sp. (strain CCB-MM4) TaxID=1926491 RepID=UPI000B9C5E22|nr:YscO family type III secretion system apparatus protein [Hahella sp. CCB-MM4]OZG74343.1 hypothetical protein BTA51_04850 [Hahella sp. CCB-MM4]
MIADVAKIKKHRTERQARKVKVLSKELAERRENREQLKQSLIDFTLWQQQETAKLFKQLADAPATLIQIDEYNSKVSAFKERITRLSLEVTQAESEEATAEKHLQDAADQLLAAQRVEEKFHYLAKEMLREQAVKNGLLEEKNAEETAMESHQGSHIPLSVFDSAMKA